eukprot:TRINITY_DN1016_c0_g1_i1.p1 TRINITY_DN1016_c0_g1~~TRINITY_DN1016_c0_g1_i1.p1  ORF type:complete len:205 (+),score=37.07 TRINITY_DN1016_c0_g1_i1:67-681(+)
MASTAHYDALMKCIIIGDCGTGKSCILHMFTEGRFLEDQTHTIGVEFGAKIIKVMGKDVKLQIWDTAGQEKYRSVTRSYYRAAAAGLIVFDLTDRKTFQSVEQWLADARRFAGEDIVVMLVGNKSDLSYGDQRKVTTQEATQLANDKGMLYFETSAVTGEYVEEAFLKIAKSVMLRQPDLPAASEAEGGLSGSSSGRKKKSCSC